jgi:multidrug efflux pump
MPWVVRPWERFHTWFNRSFENLTEAYAHRVGRVVEHKWRWLLLFAIACVATYGLFQRLPTGFLPNEDQGTIIVQWRLPAGSPRTRTEDVQRQVEQYFTKYEKANIASMFTLSGGGQGAAGQNTGQAFVTLVDWEQRPGSKNTADAIVQRANGAFRGIRDAQVFTLVPGAIRGLGSSSGFTMELQNRNGMARADFQKARDELLAKAGADDRLTNVRLSDLPDVSTLKVNSNTRALTTYGVTAANANSTLQTAWGGTYVNDFIDKGRVKRVYVQGDAQFRSRPEDLANWFVRGTSGQMVPFSAFSTISWSTAPSTSSRFNGLQAYEFSGSPGDGVSSGTAMDVMEELASQIPGTAVAWAGSSYQERLSSGQAPLLYALSLLVVFLCLAALYESWSIPIAVILVIPLGLLGAILAVTLRGLENDVYLQIGLLTTMGLAAKNAILMIEFAEQAERQGKRVIDAALEAARIRLRPILMTSFAFIFGVVPLAIASGAGANSRIAIGTAVVGGMLTATLLAIFFIPLFFVLVRRGVRDGIASVRRRMQERRARKGGAA